MQGRNRSPVPSSPGTTSHRRKNSRQEFLFLGVIAEGVDHGTDHRDAKGERRQRTGARRLLFEDEASGDRPARASIFLRPQRRDPALPVEDAMPEQHLLPGQVGLGIRDAHFRGILLRDEGTHFIAKGRVLFGKRKVHGPSPLTTSRRRGGFPARTSRRSSAAGTAASRIPPRKPAASRGRDHRAHSARALPPAAVVPIRYRRRSR